ncbi:MAG: class I SAM-dependent methyltransferase [Humibacillus sp.]|nr:class I SAM-dependent methyltransferase [Humibacillus sp.]MDN5776543.1 class I SAM-dependent methyltransferase [Humibacillus sp.]
MDYLTFLRALHDQLQPRTYVEVGVREGGSLSLSRVPSIGIDPAFSINRELAAPCHVFRTTSDEYFARPQPLAPFGKEPIDLAFIDGMHLSEFALRDFINIETFSHWAGLVIFDDMLPRTVAEAARGRHTLQWTGDVYKIIGILRRLRPDLVVTLVGTKPTGLLLVHGLDPQSRVLADAYPDLERECVTEDPQPVPKETLLWSEAVEPEDVISSPLWSTLRSARESGVTRDEGFPGMREATAAQISAMSKVAPPQIPITRPWPANASAPKGNSPRPASRAVKAQTSKAPSAPPRPLWRREASRVLRGLDRRIR